MTTTLSFTELDALEELDALLSPRHYVAIEDVRFPNSRTRSREIGIHVCYQVGAERDVSVDGYHGDSRCRAHITLLGYSRIYSDVVRRIIELPEIELFLYELGVELATLMTCDGFRRITSPRDDDVHVWNELYAKWPDTDRTLCLLPPKRVTVIDLPHRLTQRDIATPLSMQYSYKSEPLRLRVLGELGQLEVFKRVEKQ